MANLYFDSCGLFIESQTSLAAKIAALDSIIDTLYSVLVRVAGGEDVQEYQLNTSQTIIKLSGRSVSQITASIQALKIQREDYINRLNGRTIRMMDSKNFPNYGRY
jgi:hypothetical protein